MEDWQLEFEWGRVRNKLKDKMGYPNAPDFQGILFLIGVQELGKLQEVFTKEEKRDLMHIAVCKLMSKEGYYEFESIDSDGWPHYKLIRPFEETGVKTQEAYLKKLIIEYLDEILGLD